MKPLKNLRTRAKALKREITALYYAHQDPRVGALARLALLVTLGYALSPIDLIPDFIPVLGYLDDLIILPALIALSIRLIPSSVMAAARQRAECEPLQLGKNPLFALLFVLIWLAVLFLIARSIRRLCSSPPA